MEMPFNGQETSAGCFSPLSFFFLLGEKENNFRKSS